MKGEKGFTLVELLIVIVIIGILTGVVTIGFGEGQDTLKLARAANQVARDIRSTIERTVNSQVHNAGTTYENQCKPPPPDKDISPGYGIYFDDSTPTSYFVFVDCNSNNAWQPSDEKVETFSLEKGVQIVDVFPNSSPPSLPIGIFFESPDPKVFILQGNTVLASVQIVLEAGGKTKTVTITNKGVVNIN